MLTSPVFNPQERVLLHDDVSIQAGGGTNAGTVSLVSYAPKRIEVKTETSGPAILLWNDRWSPNWKALVDGSEVKLLRANYIMRGIEVPAGAHKVEMRYAQPAKMLWVSFATLGVGVLMCAFLAVDSRRAKPTRESI
jgi:hypothetical protein